MTIGASDLTLLRSARHGVRPFFNIWPREIIATADVNQSEFEYPLAEITVDNTSASWTSNVEVGMRFQIKRGSDLIATGITRKAPTSTIFYPDAKSLGDQGLMTDSIADYIQDDDTITVFNDFPLWTMLSVIRQGVFYKRYDIAYTDEGSDPAPIVNMGAWQQAFIANGASTAEFTFTALGHAWGAKTISSYLWTLPTGATLTGGGLATDTVTFTFPAGFGLVRCTVTDSTGKTRTGIRPVWANTRTGANAPDSYDRAWTIESDSQTLQGRNMSLRLYGEADIDEDTFYPTAAFYVGEEDFYWNTSTGEWVNIDDEITDRYVGMMIRTQPEGDLRKTILLAELQSPFEVLSHIPMVSQAIIETPSPADWTEVSTGLATPPFLAWYVLEHHCPNLLTLFDFNFPASLPRKRLYALNGNSVAAQLQEISALLGSNIGCGSDGSLYLYEDVMLQSSGDRATFVERITLTEADLRNQLTYPVNYRAQIGQLLLYGFALDSNDNPLPLGSLAPGQAQGQGVGRTEADALLVDDQTDINIKCGNLLAKMNAPNPEIVLDVERNMDIFDPARDYNRWYRLTVSSRYNPRGNAINTRTIVSQVNRSWRTTERGTAIKDISVTVMSETFGQPGATVNLERGGAAAETQQSGGNFGTAEDFIDGYGKFAGFAVTWNNQGGLGRTWTFTNDSPLWEDISSTSWTGNVNDLKPNPFSTLVANMYTTGAQDAWAVITSGTSLKVWYTPDIMADLVTWTLQASYTMNDSTCTSSARLFASEANSGYVTVAWRDQSGTFCGWTTDSGSTWSAATQVDAGSMPLDTANDNKPFGLWMDGTKTITTGRIAATGKYRMFLSTSPGTAFSEVANQTTSTESDSPLCPISIDGTRSYSGNVIAGTPTGQVDSDFDAGWGGWSPDDTEYLDATGGYGGTQCVASTRRIGLYVNLIIAYDLGEDVEITGVSGKVKFTYSVAPSGGQLELNLRMYDSGGLALTPNQTSFQSTPTAGTWYTLSPTGGYSGNDVRTIEIWARHTGLQSGVVFVDDVVIDYEKASGGNAVYLYQAANYATSPSWSDITPATNFAPQYPNALALDPTYAVEDSIIALGLAGGGGSQNLYDSFGGGAYTNQGAVSTNLRGLYVVSSASVSWGNGGMWYTTNYPSGFPGSSRLGNWADAIGTAGIFGGLLVLI